MTGAKARTIECGCMFLLLAVMGSGCRSPEGIHLFGDAGFPGLDGPRSSPGGLGVGDRIVIQMNYGSASGGASGRDGEAPPESASAPSTGGSHGGSGGAGQDPRGGVLEGGGVSGSTGGDPSSATKGGAGNAGPADGGGLHTGGTGPGGGACIAQIRSMDYSTPAKACKNCKDNDLSLEEKCETMLDCLEPLWPCSDCFTDCLNFVHGNQIVEDCVRAMTAAACGSP